MKILLSLCCVMLAVLFHPVAPKSEASFRIINIHPWEMGYNYFDSLAITSSEDFKAFVDEVSRQQYWSDKQGFIDALLQAKVDFNREALVLLRHDSGGGAARVTLEPPALQDKTLLCEIRSEILGASVDDMPFHCFALAVSKSLVNKVQLNSTRGLRESPRPTILLSTTERQPFNMRRDPPPQPSPPKPSPSECPKLIMGCPTDVLETGKTYEVKLIVKGVNPKDDVSYNWSVTGAEIAGGQGTRALVVRIKQPNEIVKVWVSLGGVNPYCDAVANCSCGPTK
ncbi:MAG TPA: hypothetical protein VF075_01510 [Pyrinomonadaceae bacterium]